MGRPLRIEYPGDLYHVMSRGNERGKIFGGIHYSALRKAFVRFEAELVTNASLATTIRALESHVKT
ncbi:MAG: hypothetical protein M1591_09310 [Deltaproteobacteria bacterium]|nr:hypothetical protein [Deltaproteobacteria bacterium]